MQLGCIADDYTGATDLAAALAESGLRVVLVFGLPERSAPHPDGHETDAIVVALKTRNLPASQAVAETLTALAWLRDQRADTIMFKYCSTFDSTPAGNIGPVHDALLGELGQSQSISTPATPENGRTVYLGHLFVGERLLSESGMRDHPLTPMTDSWLPRVLGAQSRADIRLVPLNVVRDGRDAVRAHLRGLLAAATGPQIVLCDAVDDEDLATIAGAAQSMRLIAGAAGLGRAFARTAGVRPGGRELRADVIAAAYGPTAVISGSCSAATLEQVDVMAARYPAFRFGPEELADDPGLVERALSWASPLIAGSPVLITASQPPDRVARAQRRLGTARAAELVETALSTTAAGLRALGVRRLVVAGGETSGAVVSRLGVRQVRIGPTLAPGVPWVYPTQGPPLLLALKSGNFGGPAFFLDAIAEPTFTRPQAGSPATREERGNP